MTTDVSDPKLATASSKSSSAHDGDLTTGTVVMTVVGALAIMVSGWVHFYLYFRGGYRGIAPDEVLGLTISRSFAINAIAAVVIAEKRSCSRTPLPSAPAPGRGRGGGLRRGDARGVLPVAHPRTAGIQGDGNHHRSGGRHGRRSGRDRDTGAGRAH